MTVIFPPYTPGGGGGGGAVDSVNGATGVVVLDADDVGAVPVARTLTAGTGLTGGGSLAANRTIALSPGSVASLMLADSAVQSVDAGTNIVVDSTDPQAPVISAPAVATTAYVDAGLATKITGGGGTPALYARDATGTALLPWSTSATANSMARRNAAGQVVVSDPTADNQATTRVFVTNLTSALGARISALETAGFIAGDGSVTNLVAVTETEYAGLTPNPTTHYAIVPD